MKTSYEISLDWLSFTWTDIEFNFDSVSALRSKLCGCFNGGFKKIFEQNPFKPLPADADGWFGAVEESIFIESLDRGLMGYENSCRIVLRQRDGFNHDLGRLAFGGYQQRGRVYVMLNSGGCSLLDLPSTKAFIESLPKYRINRLDIAFDDFNGSKSIHEVKDWYCLGRFDSKNGIRPKHNVVGPWFNDQDKSGKTFYVGNRKGSERFLRVYEKGNQLGCADSRWLRFEVEYKHTSRFDILPDVLLNLEKYFLGAYQVFDDEFSDIVNSTGEKIKYAKKFAAKIVLEKALFWFSRQYGKLVNVCQIAGLSSSTLNALIVKDGIPKRLKDFSFDELLFTIEGIKENGLVF